VPIIEDEFEDRLVIVQRRAPAGVAIAVRGGSDLPHIRTAGHHPADVVPTLAAVRDQLGLDAVVLGCRGVVVAGGVVRRVLALEALEGGSPTTDLKWVGPSDVDPPVDDWFCPSAGRRGPPDGRSWTIPGWWGRAAAWISKKVQTARLGRVLAVEQIRSWEFSCVLRVRTDQADLYFKALPRSYAREPRLAVYLARSHPGLVPDVVATNERERWLLMRACRGQCLEAGAPPSAWERAAAAYAELQVASIPRADTLQALGCRRRGPAELRTLIGPLLADESALRGQGDHGLAVDELSRLRQLRPNLEAACDELAECGLPLALEHGDLWSSNVYVSDAAVAFIDWTDASLSHPFFSLMPLLQSAEWDLAGAADARERLIDAYLERWTPYATRERLRRALALARPLAALHIGMTYWRDVPRPHTQWWIPRMVPFFVRLALEQWEAI
jgi:hypothetical protein